MKLLVRLSILALAAFGARTLFERLRPRVSGATGTGNVVGDTLTPAFREAASSVRDASTHAAHEVADATRQAAQDLKEAVVTDPPATAAGEPGTTPAPPAAPQPEPPRPAMAARDLAAEGGAPS